MGSDPGDKGSTNTIDQFLQDRSGPHSRVSQYEVNRLRMSALIVHRTFYDLNELGDNIPQNGIIQSSAEQDKQTVRVEVFTRVHNYLAALYSYNEQARSLLDENHYESNINKSDFLPNPNETSETYIPEYIMRLVFLWGLRNQFTHDRYQCLEVVKETMHNGDPYFRLEFLEGKYSPTPKGGLEEAGDYLKFCTTEDRQYPLCYMGEFHQNLFNEFESDLEEWSRRTP